MQGTSLEEIAKQYPLLVKELTDLTAVQAALRMIKNTPNKDEYFKALAIIATKYSGIYSSFEKKFEVHYEINPKTRDVKGVDINLNGFISERSIVKRPGMIYLKMFYSMKPEDALAEYDRLNSKDYSKGYA